MSFSQKLTNFLAVATEQQIITPEQNSRLLQLIQPKPKYLTLHLFMLVLSCIGGLCLVTSIILFVSHNWWLTPVWLKLCIFILSMTAIYLLALFSESDKPHVAHGLYVVASVFPLIGLGLISQIYHLIRLPASGLIVWFVTSLLLGLLLRKRDLLLISLGAFYLTLFCILPESDFFHPISISILAWPLMIWHYFWPDRKYLTWLNRLGCGILLVNTGYLLSTMGWNEVPDLDNLPIIFPILVTIILVTMIYWWRSCPRTPEITFHALWYGCLSCISFLGLLLYQVNPFIAIMTVIPSLFFLLQWRCWQQSPTLTRLQYWINLGLLACWCSMNCINSEDYLRDIININFIFPLQLIWLGIIIYLIFFPKTSERLEDIHRSQGYMQFILQLLSLYGLLERHKFVYGNSIADPILLLLWLTMAVALIYHGWSRQQFDNFKAGSLFLVGWILYSFFNLIADFLSTSIILLVLGISIILIVLIIEKGHLFINSQEKS